MSQYPFFHGASPDSFEKARVLRNNTTEAEDELWRHIRRRQLEGLRFRRQHPVSNFILDFYCHEARLAIELDGPIHNNPNQKSYDEERNKVIESLGIRTIRFKNEDIFKKLNESLRIIGMEGKSRVRAFIKSSPDGEDLGGVRL